MLTNKGIELNLKESKYYYDFLGLRFYFSSLFYKEKFENNVQDFIECESLKICNRYKISIIMNRYLSISYYRQIEKRGFRIEDLETKKDINHVFFTSNILKEK